MSNKIIADTTVVLDINTLNDFTIEIDKNKIYSGGVLTFANVEDCKKAIQSSKLVSKKSYTDTGHGIRAKKEDMNNHSYAFIIQEMLTVLALFESGIDPADNNKPWNIRICSLESLRNPKFK